MQTSLDCYLVARMISQLFPSCGHAGHTHSHTQNKHTAKQFVPVNRGSHPLSSSKDAHRKDPNLSLLVFSLLISLSLLHLLSVLFPSSLLSPMSLFSHFLFTSATIDFPSRYLKKPSPVLSNTASVAC